MNILLLGPQRHELQIFLSSFGDEIISTETQITADSEALSTVDFIISYGYRHILKKDLLDKFLNKAINLHISLLPWNKGSDPNLWSFLEDTPKGVTVHFLDSGIDSGDIIAQKEVGYQPGDTLRTSYERLSIVIEQLFMQTWPDIRSGNIKATPQPAGGSFHRLKDRAEFEHLLTNGWDTPVADLLGKAKAIIG